MDIEYEQYFSNIILDRAEEYADDESIDILKQTETQIKATVRGTAKYTVNIVLDNKQIMEMDCTCPYEDNCKHLAAVFMYLESKNKPQTIILEETPKPQKEIMALIKEAKKENLITALSAILEEYPEWEDQARVYLNTKKEGSQINYEAVVARYIAKNSNYGDFLDWNAVNDAGSHFTDLLMKISKSGKWQDQMNLSLAIIRQFNAQIFEVDDSYGQLSGSIMYAFQLLMEKISSLSESDRKELFCNLLDLLQTPDIYQWDCGTETWHLLCNLVSNEEEWQIFSKIMMSKALTGSSHIKDEMAVCSLVSLKKIGKSDEVIKEFCLANKEIPRMAEELVGMAVRAGNFVSAREIIAEGILLAQENKYPGIENQWYRNYLTVAIMENNLEEILKWSRFMFFQDYNMDDYQFFKEHVEPSQWKSELDKIIEDFKNGYHNYKQSVLQKVYAAEKMLDELFVSVEMFGSDFYVIDEYEEILKAYDKNRLIGIYENRIRKFLINNISRTYYKVAARYIRKIKKLGSEQRASDLAAELRLQYKKRSALIEELRGI